MKTNRAAAKRFRMSKNGKIKRSKANGAHLLTHKSPKQRRKLRQGTDLCPAETKRVKRMLPYS